ncbi:hypothetical protein TruAng_003959 [Truncatella angustata]|nr:hypothetical protein TruAng_003959 [Truncatella angustata]
MLIKVRTLTGKEIELDIEPEYKVRTSPFCPFPQPSRFKYDFTYLHNQAHRILHTRGRKYSADKTPQVSQIKEKVEEKEGIPPVQQRLIYGGKQMYVA